MVEIDILKQITTVVVLGEPTCHNHSWEQEKYSSSVYLLVLTHLPVITDSSKARYILDKEMATLIDIPLFFCIDYLVYMLMGLQEEAR